VKRHDFFACYQEVRRLRQIEADTESVMSDGNAQYAMKCAAIDIDNARTRFVWRKRLVRNHDRYGCIRAMRRAG
jgi:hypothetical protein